MSRKAVFLDVGWTLIRPVRSMWQTLSDVAAAAGHALPADECEARFFALWQASQENAVAAFHAEAEYLDSDEEFSGVFRQLAQAAFVSADIPDPRGELADAFARAIGSREGWGVYPDVFDVLREMRARGLALAVVSNAASDLPAFLEWLGLAPFFDVILASAAEGRKKPDRRLFQRALDRTGVAAAAAIHVGDMALEDVLGARNAGVQPALMHRGRESLFPSFPPLLPEGVGEAPVLSGLREVLPLLR
jgi:putative hydrolase of the HAD superfamily